MHEPGKAKHWENVRGCEIRLSVEFAKAATCATTASNQQATTLTHILSIYHVLALNIEIYLGNFVLTSNAEHIEPIVAPKPV